MQKATSGAPLWLTKAVWLFRDDLVDQIYRNRENRGFCKKYGIQPMDYGWRPLVNSSPDEKMETALMKG